MTTGALTENLRETLALFDVAGRPWTTTEVAERLDLGRRSTYERLERLVSHGRIETKKVGANARVWWRPGSTSAAPSNRDGRDVTERKERERELERYVGIIDAVGEPVYELDAAGRITFVNEAFVEQSGYSEDELVGSHVSIGMGDDAIRRAESLMMDLLEDGSDGNATLEYDVVTKDGDRIPTENRFTLLSDEDGEVRGSAGILRDVTDRVERERALEESVRRYRTLVDNFPNGAVALFDEDLRYLTVGGELYHGLELSPEGLAGDLLTDRLPGDLLAVLEPPFRAAFDGEHSEFDVEFDGQIRHVRVVPVTDERGTVYAGMAVSQDVTEQKEHERELERQREYLAALNTLNDIVRGITDAVIDRSTREEIEETVCERLASTDSYASAWIGDVDVASQAVSVRTEAGATDYLEDLTISVDPDDPRSQGLTARALLTGEIQTAGDLQNDSTDGPGRGLARETGVRSSAAIPIVHQDTTYGALTVSATRPHAFEGEEREVVGQLGEIVGHAIAATDRKRALMSDEIVELQFRIRDFFDVLGVDVQPAGRIELDHAVPVADGDHLVYGRVSEDAVDSLVALAELPDWGEVTLREGVDEMHFEHRLGTAPLLSQIASLGGSVESSVVEDGDCRLTVHLAPGADVRQAIDVVESAYPTSELLKHHQITRRDETEARVRDVLTEDLTDRQRTVLEAASHAGFYEWPRGASGEDVAASLGIAPPTFHQHLRKAEGKVIGAVLSMSTPA